MSHQPTAPQARGPEHMQGHWLLASLGKRVLRPGGAALSRWLVGRAEVRGRDVVELAPGLGHTAAVVLHHSPRSYVGIDIDPAALDRARAVIGDRGTLVQGEAAQTGLGAETADVVLGEAMLTMQGQKAKDAIVAEAYRVLRPGGTYAIHELGLTPDAIDEQVTEDIRRALARAIKVNARPLTAAEWTDLLTGHGFEVEQVETAPMALLEPRRLVADEGPLGAAKFAVNLLRRPDARRRVFGMRAVFREHARSLTAIALVARRPDVATD